MDLLWCLHHHFWYLLSEANVTFSRTKSKTFWDCESAGARLLFQVLPAFLQTLVNGLIPPAHVYSGRLKSSRPPPLSPNLQPNPLGLKPPPHERRWSRGWGRDGGGDWTGAVFYESGLEPPPSQGNRQQPANISASSVLQTEQT